MYEIQITKVNDYNKLKCIYDSVSNAYDPPLNYRIDNYEYYVTKLFDKAENYYATLDDEILGVISFYSNDLDTKIAFISQIVVMGHFRGHGLGKILLEKCIAESRIRGMKLLKLEVRLDNLNAINFYKMNEFVEEQRTPRNTMYMIRTIE